MFLDGARTAATRQQCWMIMIIYWCVRKDKFSAAPYL